MTRFNIAALQEQGMTRDEINKYISERERAMYGGPRGTSASGPPRDIGRGDGYSEPDTPREVYPTQTQNFDTPAIQVPISGEQGEPERQKIEENKDVFLPKKKTSSESTSFQSLLNNLQKKETRKDTRAMVQEDNPKALASFQAMLQKLQGG